jgi:ATP/maltotriose-dependent transcriptional regulator MalT
MIDVWLGNLHIVQQGQISNELRFYLSHFPHRLTSQDLSRKRSSLLLKQKSNWRRITLPT